MYNSEANAYSNKCLDEQISFLKTSQPNIKQVLTIDNVANMKADYLYSVDAIAVDASGNSKTVQFKCRKEGNRDLVLPVKKLTGKAALDGDIGFWFKDSKYTFFPAVDLYVERIEGKDYSFTADQLHGIEALHKNDLQDILSGVQAKYVYADNGNKFPTGDYYAFVKPNEMLKLQVELFKKGNPNYNYSCR